MSDADYAPRVKEERREDMANELQPMDRVGHGFYEGFVIRVNGPFADVSFDGRHPRSVDLDQIEIIEKAPTTFDNERYDTLGPLYVFPER